MIIRILIILFILTNVSYSKVPDNHIINFINEITECINKSKVNPKVNRELTIVQAALESHYGLSRFAKKGNNLFGIKIFKNLEEGILPLDTSKYIPWRMAKFETKCDSVDAYMNLLNTGSNFKEYRKERDYQKYLNINNPIPYFKTLKLYATNINYEKLLLDVYKKLKEHMAATNKQ